MARPRRPSSGGHPNQSYTRSNDYSRKRDPSRIATGSIPVLSLTELVAPSQPTLVRSLLSEVEDYRTFHPEPFVAPRTIRQRVARTAIKGSVPWRQREQLHFSSPRNVIICHRRKSRKEVLHALGKTGKGGGSKKRRYRRNAHSEVYC